MKSTCQGNREEICIRSIFDRNRPRRTVAVVRDNQIARDNWRHAFKYCFRLDLDPVILAGPEPTDHTCLYDQFYVTGGSNPVPTICGTNIGHHSKSPTTQGSLKLETFSAYSAPLSTDQPALCTYHFCLQGFLRERETGSVTDLNFKIRANMY